MVDEKEMKMRQNFGSSDNPPEGTLPPPQVTVPHPA